MSQNMNKSFLLPVDVFQMHGEWHGYTLFGLGRSVRMLRIKTVGSKETKALTELAELPKRFPSRKALGSSAHSVAVRVSHCSQVIIAKCHRLRNLS